jgi:hypothetical protein
VDPPLGCFTAGFILTERREATWKGRPSRQRDGGSVPTTFAAVAMLAATLNSLLAADTVPEAGNETGGTAAPASVVPPDAGVLEPTTEIRLTEVDIE